MKPEATWVKVPSVELARIFHPSLLRKPGRPVDAVLGLNFDLDSMKHTATASKLFACLAPSAFATFSSRE